MKNISNSLKEQINSQVTTLAICWKIELSDASILCFTDHDSDLSIDSTIYLSTASFIASNIVDNSSFAIDNLDIQSILNSDLITEEDLLAGKYDFAKVSIFLVNYADLSQGILQFRCGKFGQVTIEDGRFTVEIRGLKDNLRQSIGELYSPICRANFCDSRCALNPNNFTVEGVVEGAINRNAFYDSSLPAGVDLYNYGVVTFVTGNNEGISIEVKEHQAGGNIILALPAPYQINIGDEYRIIEGCNKKFSTCVNRFNNTLNFRGEPHVPGIDALYKTSGTL